jgi:hypothetical protein
VCVNLLNRASNEANRKGKQDQTKTDAEGGRVEVDGDGATVSRA